MSEPDARQQEALRQAWLSAGAPILALVFTVVAAALAVFVNFAGQQDQAYARTSQALVESALAGRLQAQRDLTLDLANWNDAYQAVAMRGDRDWLASNYSSSVSDGVIVFDAQGRIVHTWLAPNLLGSSARLPREIVAQARAVPGLAALIRESNVQETARSITAAIDGRLTLLAVAPVSQEDDAVRMRDAARGATHYVVSVQILTEPEIVEMGAALNLRGLRFVSGDRPTHTEDAIALKLDGAPAVGALIWRHERPGSAAFVGQAGPVLLGIVIIGVFTLLVTRTLVRRQLDIIRRFEAQFAADRMRAALLIEVSEELRSPLNAIIGYAELLQEESPPGPGGERVRQDAGRILAAAKRLHRIISRPLQALRPKQRAQRAEPADQDA